MEPKDENREIKDFTWKEANKEETLSILRRYNPESIFFQHFIEGTLKWSSRCSGVKTTLYLPRNSKWEGSVIIDVKGQLYFVTIFWPYKDISYLISSIRKNNMVDLKRGPKFMFGVPKESYVHLDESFETLGLERITNDEVFVNLLTADKAEKIEANVPQNMKVTKLYARHASIVNSEWRGAIHGSIDYIKNMISINHSVGLTTDNGSKLVCWLLETNYGFGMLHTIPEYRRRGYGTTLVKLMSKMIGKEGNDVIALVAANNSASQKIFKNLGFQKLCFLKVMKTPVIANLEITNNDN